MGKSVISISDEIWNILKETQKNLREVSVDHKEAKQEMREIRASQKELSASQKETNEQMKRTDARIDQAIGETNEQMKRTDARIDQAIGETNEQMKRTDARIDKVIGDWGNRWGKLGENLVKGSLVQRLNERGIKVERILTNAKVGYLEFDIIAINGKEVVVVEVKATLDPLDVDKFSENMKKFTTLWPEFKGKIIYGAMAFLMKANRQADSLAQKQGFFVISATGDVIIQNNKDFKAKDFS